MSNGINALIAQGGWKEPKFDVMETAKNALLMRRAKQETEAYPEEQNWLREQRGVARTKFSQEQAAEQRRLDWEPFTDEVTAAEGLKKIIPFLNEQNWDASMEHLGTVKKIDKSYLPSLASLKQQAMGEGISPEEFPQWLEDYKMKKVHALDYYKAQTERAKLTKPDLSEKGKISRDYEAEVRDKATKLVEESTRAGTPIPYSEAVESVKKDIEKKYYPEKAETKSNIGKLIDEYNALDPKDPNKQFYLGAIKKQAETMGTQLRVHPDGTVEMIQGPIGSREMMKPIQTKIQEKLFNATESMARLNGILGAFKPEFQEWGTRIGTTWSSIKAKAGKNLSPKDTKTLTEFATYKRKSLENINNYIKEITGAQMSEAEANRLRQAAPDPGEGIFGGDDPISFKAKLDDVIKQTKLSIVRYQMLLKQGMTPDLINNLAKSDNLPDLDKAKDFINQRGKEIEQEFSSQLSGNELKLRVAQELNKEFGL